MENNYKRTQQQQEIVDSDVDSLVVDALAGTGKTSSLVDFSEVRPDKKILYLAFNKAIVQAAVGKFPSNVKIMTSHGLAFSDVGKYYADANKLSQGIRPYEIMNALQIRKHVQVPEDMLNLFVHRVAATLNTFIASTQENVSLDMVNISDKSQRELRFFNPAEIVKYTEQAWSIMADLNDRRIGMTHDGYLKVYMDLCEPMDEYDYILFDEAQDSTPVTLGIVAKQNSRKVFVGDPNQAIYKFRGAINALEQIPYDKRVALTNSFRFGSSVAGVANMMLAYKGSNHFISGVGNEDEVGHITSSDRYAFISRTNMSILDRAVELLKDNKKIHFVGGFEGYRFSQLMDVYNLKYRTGEVKDPFIKTFGDYAEFATYASHAMDIDYASRVGMVDKYKNEIPKIMEMAEKNNVPAAEADVFLSTAHKAKGLEFEKVRLADDFMPKNPMVTEYGTIEQPTNMEEINIAYVAATRARKTLDIGEGHIKVAYENQAIRALVDREMAGSSVISKLNPVNPDFDPAAIANKKRKPGL